jgi:hypothetical protein
MIRNLTEEVEEIVKSALAPHVTSLDEMTFSVAPFTETALIFGENGPSIEQAQCIGIWIMLDTDEERLSTRWSCAIEDWTEEVIREELVTVWDALVVRRMEETLKKL